MKMTAKRKTELLVSWCKRHICDEAKAKWRVQFSEHYSDYVLELSLMYKTQYFVNEYAGEGTISSASTKHEALNRMLRRLSERFDVPSSFEEMAIAEAVGA